MAAPTRVSTFFVATICAASVCADEGARHARDLLERWPALTISERIAQYLDASDVAALRHDFDQLDIDSDAVLDIADVLVALEGTSGRRNAPRAGDWSCARRCARNSAGVAPLADPCRPRRRRPGLVVAQHRRGGGAAGDA